MGTSPVCSALEKDAREAQSHGKGKTIILPTIIVSSDIICASNLIWSLYYAQSMMLLTGSSDWNRAAKIVSHSGRSQPSTRVYSLNVRERSISVCEQRLFSRTELCTPRLDWAVHSKSLSSRRPSQPHNGPNAGNIRYSNKGVSLALSLYMFDAWYPRPYFDTVALLYYG